MVKWLPLLPVGELVVTDSEEFVGVHDVVSSEERAAVLDTLDAAGVKYRYYPRLTDSIQAIIQAAQADDVVLMGGCQGLDHGAHVVIPILAKRHSNSERREILQILQDRVAGSS